MRELSFRIWDKKEKTMFLSPIEIEHLGSWFDAHLAGAIADTGNKIVMQYTGLKDKNGKEIYEGDVVRVFQPFNVPTKAIVELNDGCFELKGIELTWRDYVKCFVVNHAIEIIGNIHDNPELLEEELK